MNSLFYLFPSDSVDYSDEAPIDICQSLINIATFLDHEDCDMYWDEEAYKKVRGKIAGEDRLSQGLRRNRLQHFTHYRHFTDKRVKGRAFIGDNEVTDDILGRYALYKYYGVVTQSTIVCHGKIRLADTITILLNETTSGQIETNSRITDVPSAVGWFAINRNPQRIFNFDAPKHKTDKPYLVDGVSVSPMQGSREEINSRLYKAIGVSGKRRLMHYDTQTGLFYIFSDENRKDDQGRPVYHGHQIDSRQKSEINRLPAAFIKKIQILTGVDLRI